MPTLEERVAYLEGRVEAQAHGAGELRELVGHLDHKVDRFREELAGRIEAVDQKVDRFREELLAANAATNARIEALDQLLSGRIDAVDQKVDRVREELARGIERLDQKVSKHFVWLVGIQVAVLLAVISAVLGK
jgi:uncharacterized coiled-coil protein SlyX